MDKDLLLSDQARENVFKRLLDKLEEQNKAETKVLDDAYVELMTQFIDQQVYEQLGTGDPLKAARSTSVANAISRIDAQENKIADLEARREMLEQLQTTPGELITKLKLFAQGL